MAEPVFYDPQRARWKRLRRLVDALVVALSALVIFFVYTTLRDERLPELLFSPQKRAFKALKESEKEKARDRQKKLALRSHRKTKLPPSEVTLNEEEGIRAAFYVPWDAASFSSLRDFSRQIDLLYPDWLHVLTPDGHLQAVDDQTNKFFDVLQNNHVRSVDDRVMPLLKGEDSSMEVFPMVNNFDGTEWVGAITDFLNDPAARVVFRRQVSTFLSSDRFRGLMVDFEAFPSVGQPGYVALLNELSSDLHARGMKLYVSVPAHNEEFDYAAIAAPADGVVVMNYDEHYPGAASGPVASQDWFVENLRFDVNVIPREKLICAIANYGYDWVLKPKKGKLPPDAKDHSVSVQEAWLEARDSEEDVTFDDDALNPHFSYLDESSLRHDVWFLDAVTALNHMRAAQMLGIRTFALWKLGGEDRTLWRVWDIPGDPTSPAKLRSVPPGQDVDMEGQGEILRIESRPTPGVRDLTIDAKTKIITDENFQALPEPYRVARYGYSPNKVALTFDDGPDPEWTPKILDVLKREHASATFFLIGIQGDKFSGLVHRIYDEGHIIGNHTFTHPDVSNISNTYMKVELNLTERFFASLVGVRAMLFRPPYAIDEEPDTADQVRPLEIPQDMGYITVGNRIDPNDWSNNPRRSAEQISSYVLSHLPPCRQEDLRCGNIVLLHDGGGNRVETVRALPMIIEGIRSRGYEIAPVYELLGKTRADVMAPLPTGQRWAARLDRLGFWLFDVAVMSITLIFFLGDLLMTGRLLFIGAAAVYDRLAEKIFGRPAEVASYKPKVAVLIPAFNEEKVIERTVRAALNSNYPNLRVIVIDDGSRDRTLEVARAAFAREEAAGRVLVLTKPNAGKAEALNYGIEHIQDAELFVGIDADTIIANDAIARLVPHFINPRVGAIAGNAKVGNRVNLWTRWQALEYITSQNFERRALDVLGAVSVVPGAIGAWRVSAVREAGGYQIDTVAEDADLTMALLRRGYRVEYEDMALAYTEAPTNANGLMRQRFRWSFGILQAVYKHRGVFARKGALGFVALPNIVIFQILLPLVSPLIDIMFAFGAIWYFIQKHFHPDSTDPASFHKLVAFFFAFLVIDFLASALAFALERRRPDDKEDPWLLSQVWLQRFAYRQLFSVVLFKTLKRALEGRRFAWDKLERTAAVNYVPSESRDQVNVP
ncbi:MAG TPA: glycosyltransferase [Candidatus Acidoferrum sp.]|jgi:cellulose synthase/poly-beta-1,6-N-acetylglucosamine synthase-like glycosyltransferase/spore germination protein YaaH/peptidoglycan/xylan/chitin deacetylase (PgdA/CDA1 family)|nr:glycosyltransferase [Candidatus Acidoferrum sp.]